jgi:hypothetical protein
MGRPQDKTVGTAAGGTAPCGANARSGLGTGTSSRRPPSGGHLLIRRLEAHPSRAPSPGSREGGPVPRYQDLRDLRPTSASERPESRVSPSPWRSDVPMLGAKPAGDPRRRRVSLRPGASSAADDPDVRGRRRRRRRRRRRCGRLVGDRAGPGTAATAGRHHQARDQQTTGPSTPTNLVATHDGEAGPRISRGSRAAPANGSGAGASTSSCSRSGGSVRGSRRTPCRSRPASSADRR